MTYTEFTLPRPDGSVAGLDFGGSGPDVLILHSPGGSSHQWRALAESLAGAAHVRAIDLPGHGHSTVDVPPDSPASLELLQDVVAALGLRRPVLVAGDASSYYALCIAVRRPELVGALVLMGGGCIHDPERTRQVLEFVTNPEFARNLRQRFCRGERGTGEAGRAAFLEHLTEMLGQDWSLQDYPPEEFRADKEYAVVLDPATGAWMHMPAPESVQVLFRVPDDADPYPDRSIYARCTVPTWLVMATEGPDMDEIEPLRELAAANPHVHLVEIPAVVAIQYTHADELADVVLAACEGVAAPEGTPGDAA